MLLMFSSTLQGENKQANFVSTELKRRNADFILVDVHDLATKNDIVLSYEKQGVFLKKDGKNFSPDKIYVSNIWREDAIIRLPDTVDTPQLVRSKIHQFLEDIRFSFEDATWLPGKIEAIERCDSKHRLFIEAEKLGFLVPEFTYNAQNPFCETKFPVYKKSLGYPFGLTYSKSAREEVFIATTNILVNQYEDHEIDDCLFWQWQQPIFSEAQIRCQIVKDKMWAVVWKKKSFSTEDLRYQNDIEKSDIKWEPYDLPSQLKDSLFNLINKLGVSVASPEFLIGKGNQLFLIDLNPCGDWFGFFDEKTKIEIRDAIIELCL